MGQKKGRVLFQQSILTICSIFTSIMIVFALRYPAYLAPKRDDLSYKVYSLAENSGNSTYHYISIANPGESWRGYVSVAESNDSVRHIEVSVPAHGCSSFLIEGIFNDLYLSDRYFRNQTEEEYHSEGGYAVGIFSDSSKELCSVLANRTINVKDVSREKEYAYTVLPMILDEDNFLRTLPGMASLIMDDYETEALTPVMKRALQNWIASGGILISGGKAEFGKDAPDVQKQVYGIYASLPYEVAELAVIMQENQNSEHVVELMEELEKVRSTDRIEKPEMLISYGNEDYTSDVMDVFDEMLYYPVTDQAEAYEAVFKAMVGQCNIKVATVTTRDISKGGISKTWFRVTDSHRYREFYRTKQAYDSFRAVQLQYRQTVDFYAPIISHEDSTHSIAIRTRSPYQAGIFLGQKYDNPSEEIGMVDIDTLTVNDDISGEIVNQTNRDFSCFLVMKGNKSWLFGALPAGETLVCDAQNAIHSEDAAHWILASIRNAESVPSEYIPLIIGLWHSDFAGELTVVACTTEHPDIMEGFRNEISYESIVVPSSTLDKEKYALLKEKGTFSDVIIKECYY